MEWLKMWKKQLACVSVQREGGDRGVSVVLLTVEGVGGESRAKS